ncbi:hypothetical protein NP92_03385 [Anoxybacillus gonensis]|uniref:Uncharacterized protein n=1 Tax=Anoxybacillus flavithermus TaxID=33934 RepID=A0A2G5RRM9_9BACL|nr:hypothetical protein AFK25_02955 [Anoxybacillus gonensis]AXM88368.1 hypothetical protein B379_03700 [Anoxybacillus ayderensis G10]KFZ42217.1 hypothetical protein JS80_11400 [Anoxybacillus sp. KU2-6(11)]PIC05339.1 hypothetical protein CS060_05555 [Anoxybacillus flavithermus]THD16831.1 hypothetical protein CI793_05085 [Anoxybacillus ayderensis]
MTNKKWFLYFLLLGIPSSIYGLIIICKSFFYDPNLFERVGGGLFLIHGLFSLFFAKRYAKCKEEGK